MKQESPVADLRIDHGALQTLVCQAPIQGLHCVRPQMIAMGKKLLLSRSYPTDEVVDRLAELFAAEILAERN